MLHGLIKVSKRSHSDSNLQPLAIFPSIQSTEPQELLQGLRKVYSIIHRNKQLGNIFRAMYHTLDLENEIRS